MTRRSSTKPGHVNAQKTLDALPAGAVVLDCHGDAWQRGGPSTPYWYRAYGTLPSMSDYELAFRYPVTVIHPQEAAA